MADKTSIKYLKLLQLHGYITEQELWDNYQLRPDPSLAAEIAGAVKAFGYANKLLAVMCGLSLRQGHFFLNNKSKGTPQENFRWALEERKNLKK